MIRIIAIGGAPTVAENDSKANFRGLQAQSRNLDRPNCRKCPLASLA